MTLLTVLIAGAALGLAIWDWLKTAEPDADARDPNVVAFKRDYPARARWRNGAPRKPAA